MMFDHCAMQAARPLVAGLAPPRSVRGRFQRRYGIRASTAAGGGSEGKDAQARVLEQVETSAAIINDMMGEITREMFLDAAVSHVTELPEASSMPARVVSAVVGRRLEQLDSSFLSTLDAFIQGASDKGAMDVAEVLLLVRDEVLHRLNERLPPEMQLLEAALSAPDSKARMALLRRYAVLSAEELPAPPAGRGTQQDTAQPGGDDVGRTSAAAGGGKDSSGSGDVSSGAWLHCLAADLERAVWQVVSDMELMLEVPDRRLLAKLVLVWEEVHQTLAEAAYLGTGGQLSGDPAAMQQPFRTLGAIPRSCAVFLQRLMALAASAERRALLEHAFRADREGLPSTKPGADATNFERVRSELERPQDWVRPGRFMQSVNAMQQELLQPSSKIAAPSEAVLERLESIRREAMSVLIDMAGEGQPFLP